MVGKKVVLVDWSFFPFVVGFDACGLFCLCVCAEWGVGEEGN